MEVRMTSQKAGEIKMLRGDPHICIQLNGRWQYQALTKLSQAKFKKHRITISKNVHNLLTKLDIAQENGDIEISGAASTTSGNIINNIWKEDPSKRAPDERTSVYHSNRGHWLYSAIRNRAMPGNPNPIVEYQWWIGTEENMNNRKAWGWFRSDWLPVPDIFLIQRWWSFNHETSKWIIGENIKIILLTIEEKTNRQVQMKIETIEKNCALTISNCETIAKQLAENENRHKAITRELFNEITKEKRQRIFEKYRGVFKQSDLCSICFRDAPSKKCIHHDCCGACETCMGEPDKPCCACGKKQILECPICLDEHPPSYMKRFTKCSHAVCWHCYAMSFEAKKALVKCPKCRQSI